MSGQLVHPKKPCIVAVTLCERGISERWLALANLELASGVSIISIRTVVFRLNKREHVQLKLCFICIKCVCSILVGLEKKTINEFLMSKMLTPNHTRTINSSGVIDVAN